MLAATHDIVLLAVSSVGFSLRPGNKLKKRKYLSPNKNHGAVLGFSGYPARRSVQAFTSTASKHR
jgi:hypothetical protein